MDERLDALVAPLRADVVSGAAVVGRTAADVLRRAAVRLQAGSREEYRWALGEVSAKILDAQPAMASLFTLVRDVLAAVEASDGLEDARHAAARAADGFRSGLEARTAGVAEQAQAVLPARGRVATLSSSSTVRAALLRAAPGRALSVLCLESRPMQEGQLLAAALAREGVPVTYAVDAAADSLVGDCAAVLLGADSIGDLGVVNKIGSTALATAAGRAGVPVYVLSDETKILPAGFPQHAADDRPAEEVWRAPAGVRVWNRYFEAVPLGVVTRIVTENGSLSPADVETMRAGIRMPEGLLKWAEARARGKS